MSSSAPKQAIKAKSRRIGRPIVLALSALFLLAGTAVVTYRLASAPVDVATASTAAANAPHSAAETDALAAPTPTAPTMPASSPSEPSEPSTPSTDWGADGAVGEDGGPGATNTDTGTAAAQTPSRANAPDGVCTAGVSACAFENYIDFTAVYRAVAGVMRQDFRSDAITCDLGQVPPNRAQVGEVLACGVLGQERISPTVAIKVTDTGSHFRLITQPTVLEKYRGDCTRVVTSALQQADRSGDAALAELGRRYGRSSDLYSLAYDRLYGTEGNDPHLVCDSPQASDGLNPYPGSPMKFGDEDPGGFSGLSALSAVQESLLERGYDVNLNGRFDRDTERAVKQFQAEHGLTADGIVGAVTWRWLFG